MPSTRECLATIGRREQRFRQQASLARGCASRSIVSPTFHSSTTHLLSDQESVVTESTSNRLHRVDAMFDAVLDQPTADQSAFVERVAANDPAQRDEFMELLRAHHLTGSVLDMPAS